MMGKYALEIYRIKTNLIVKMKLILMPVLFSFLIDYVYLPSYLCFGVIFLQTKLSLRESEGKFLHPHHFCQVRV
jgi:hypothetical protein